MTNCYLTGAGIDLSQSFVINRSAAYALLVKLNERSARLRRLLDQLSPLDAPITPQLHTGEPRLP